MKTHILIRNKKKINKYFIRFLYPLMAVLLADSILSYTFPILVNESLQSPLILGMIMGLSSIVGIGMDLIIPKFFHKFTWKEFLILGIGISITYPIVVYVGTHSLPILMFMLGSITWGIYFEFLSFAQQNFIVNEESRDEYTRDWGIIHTLWQFTALLSPIIATFLLSQSILHFTVSIVSIQTCALLFCYFLFIKVKNESIDLYGKKVRSHLYTSIKFLKEITLLQLLGSRIISIFFVGLLSSSILAMFWTIGGIYGVELMQSTEKGWIILFVFNLGILSGSAFLIYNPINKNRMKLSQALLMFSALLLVPIAFTQSKEIIIILVALVSILLSTVGPLNDSEFSAIAERNEDSEIYIMSLSRIMNSLAFVISPFLAGLLAQYMSFEKVFSIFGVIIFILSVIIFLKSPRRIRLPQTQIEEIFEG